MYTELHPDAEIELTEHAFYYESREPGLGYRFIDEIEHGIKLLNSQPRIGREMDNAFRCLVLDDFPFLLIYRIEPEKIWILAVAHQSVQVIGENEWDKMSACAGMTALFKSCPQGRHFC